MDRKLIELMKKEKMYEYLKKESYFVKELNRNPNFYKQFKEIIKDKYKLRTSDKISEIIEDISTVSSIIDIII